MTLGKRYFISGHLDLSEEDFNEHYRQQIINAANDPESTFVMGSAPGADSMGQKLLVELFQPNGLDRITVYHKGEQPETPAHPGVRLQGGFASHDAKDSAMTHASDIDIAYVRSEEESKALYGEKYRPGRISGTQKNLERRKATLFCPDFE
jgi:hypothetical protein